MKSNTGNLFGSEVILKNKNSAENVLALNNTTELIPDTGSFTLSLMEQAEGTKLSVYNTSGNHIIKSMVLNQGLKEISINNQPKGTYYVEIANGRKKNTSKIVIQ